MKNLKKTIVICSILIVAAFSAQAQDDENEYVKIKASGLVDSTTSDSLIFYLTKGEKQEFVNKFKTIVRQQGFDSITTDMQKACLALIDTSANHDVFAEIEKAGIYRDYAVIFIYRKMKKGTNSLSLDYESVESLIYHKKKIKKNGTWETGFTNYLLGTKKVFVVFIDASDTYYEVHPDDNDKKLNNTTISIERLTSFFNQGLKDTKTLLQSGALSMSNGSTNLQKLTITIAELDPKRVKTPCNIVLANKSFKEDVKFKVHEWNMASIQLGLVNNKFNSQNFSITGGNLVVTPDSAQKTEWKSNFYALIEVHLPRDIDNFQPIWKAMFGEDPDKRGFAHWLYRITVQRLGIYGGAKISSDPLSNIYAGFNYAVTKELSVNFGWTWTNEVVPQVTNVGDVKSIDDAIKYAKRDYAKPTFSWGLSFAPSQIIAMFGNKDKGE